MKKRPGLLLPMLLMLVSCGEPKTYAGTYAFQLGKDKSTHIGIYMKLTDDAQEDVTDAKKFELSFDISGSSTNTSDVSSYLSSDSDDKTSSSSAVLTDEEEGEETEEEDTEVDTTALLQEFISKDVVIKGYYIVDETTDTSSTSKNVSLGVDLLNSIFDSEYSFVIPTGMMEKFLYAKIDSTTLSLNFPVSLNDLYYQLYWYGYRIDVDNFTFDTLEAAHDVGTHPTEDDIKAIRKYEASLDNPSSLFTKFRDFHVLTMGLVKE